MSGSSYGGALWREGRHMAVAEKSRAERDSKEK